MPERDLQFMADVRLLPKAVVKKIQDRAVKNTLVKITQIRCIKPGVKPETVYKRMLNEELEELLSKELIKVFKQNLRNVGGDNPFTLGSKELMTAIKKRDKEREAANSEPAASRPPKKTKKTVNRR